MASESENSGSGQPGPGRSGSHRSAGSSRSRPSESSSRDHGHDHDDLGSPRSWTGQEGETPFNAADNNPNHPSPADDPVEAVKSLPDAREARHEHLTEEERSRKTPPPQVDLDRTIPDAALARPDRLSDAQLARLADSDDPEVIDNLRQILLSPSYRVAMNDLEFLHSPALRPLRLELELLKVELTLEQEQVESTIVVFGGTQLVSRDKAEARLATAKAMLELASDDPARQREVRIAERVLAKAHYYDEAREFSRLVSHACQNRGVCNYVIVTGGGPGIMEAANRGAYDVGAKSIGLNITLPEEQVPNPYITPELCFQFHYFALRKMHFLMRAKALVVFPGGYGTLDELFEVLTLRQTGRMQPIPIILCGREYWNSVINFQALADEGVIRDEHLELLEFTDTAAESWKIIQAFHADPPPV